MYRTADEMARKIEDYWDYCAKGRLVGRSIDKHGKIKEVRSPIPLTISGLAWFLGMDRDTVLGYQKKDEFAGLLAQAKARIKAFAEESLWVPQISAGVMFSMVNTWGWKNKSEIELAATVQAPQIEQAILAKIDALYVQVNQINQVNQSSQVLDADREPGQNRAELIELPASGAGSILPDPPTQDVVDCQVDDPKPADQRGD